MRGETERQSTLMLGLTPEGFVPRDHPLRRIKPLVDSALGRMSPLFDEIYAAGGRPSIPPEHLLKASLLMAFYTIRSERQFCEQLRYNILFKWFLDLNVEDEPFHPTTFTKNRVRLLEADAARVLLKEVVREARRRRLLSADHFTVDGTLLEAWASHKSYRPRDEQPAKGGGRNRDADFQGERRSRDTHVSTTDLYRKGKQQEARLCYLGHVLTENRYGLVVDVELTEADGYAEREAALAMLERSVCGPATLGADRAYDTRDFVWNARALGVTPHVAQNDRGRRSAIDGRTTRHDGYRQSQRRRKRVEEVFGWIKTIGGGGKLRYLGRARNKLWFRADRRRLQPHPPGPTRSRRRLARRWPNPTQAARTSLTAPTGPPNQFS